MDNKLIFNHSENWIHHQISITSLISISIPKTSATNRIDSFKEQCTNEIIANEILTSSKSGSSIEWTKKKKKSHGIQRSTARRIYSVYCSLFDLQCCIACNGLKYAYVPASGYNQEKL